MPDIVGVDTLLEGDLPEQAANYGPLSVFAAKTQTDWETELTDAETDRWGGGVLEGLFAGLQQGKPFVVALIEAVIHEIFEDIEDFFEDVGDAFGQLGMSFNGKWRDIIAAKDAADYANAQLAVSTRPIKDLFDGAAGDLSSTLWDISYSDDVGGLAGGEVQQDGNGNAWWDGFGIAARKARCRYKDLTTTTDDQIVTVVMPLRVQPPAPLTGQSYLRLLVRMNAARSEYVYAQVTDNSVSIGYQGGQWATTGTATQDGDVWDFFCQGTYFVLKRNGLMVLDYDDTGAVAEMDSDHRYVGFEMFANSRGLLGQTSPGVMAVLSADDY